MYQKACKSICALLLLNVVRELLSYPETRALKIFSTSALLSSSKVFLAVDCSCESAGLHFFDHNLYLELIHRRLKKIFNH